MRHLSKGDLDSVSELAIMIYDNTGYKAPNEFDLTISNFPIKVKLAECSSKNDIRENRASCSEDGQTISLSVLGIDTENCPATHIEWLLIHEATHSLHIKLGCFGGELGAASGLAANYEDSKSFEDYTKYVYCEAERPAHAAQLAFELRLSDNNKDNLADSWLHSHFKKKCGSPADESNLEKLICELFSDANAINDALKENP